MWELPPAEWVKYNTDEAFRGNSRPSSYDFYVRNEEGDILYIEYNQIEDTIII